MTDNGSYGSPEGVQSFAMTDKHAPERADNMTLRDYFAGQSLVLSAHRDWFLSDPKHEAKRAYQMADAMLEARKVKP